MGVDLIMLSVCAHRWSDWNFPYGWICLVLSCLAFTTTNYDHFDGPTIATTATILSTRKWLTCLQIVQRVSEISSVSHILRNICRTQLLFNLWIQWLMAMHIVIFHNIVYLNAFRIEIVGTFENSANHTNQDWLFCLCFGKMFDHAMDATDANCNTYKLYNQNFLTKPHWWLSKENRFLWK